MWKEKAEQYIQQQLIDFYALLPAMGGANKKLLDEAIDQMVLYYQDNQARLALAQQEIQHISRPEKLRILLNALKTASNENIARALLKLAAA